MIFISWCKGGNFIHNLSVQVLGTYICWSALSQLNLCFYVTKPFIQDVRKNDYFYLKGSLFCCFCVPHSHPRPSGLAHTTVAGLSPPGGVRSKQGILLAYGISVVLPVPIKPDRPQSNVTLGTSAKN